MISLVVFGSSDGLCDLETNLFSANLTTLKGLIEISLICRSFKSPYKEIKIRHNLFQVKDTEIEKINNSECVKRKQFGKELATVIIVIT